MDNFELKTEPKVKRKPVIWNILTILVLLLACYLAYFFLTIFQQPQFRLQPFPSGRTPHSLPDPHSHAHHHRPARHLDAH